MEYFTLRIKSQEGAIAFQTDFTLREFAPVIAQILLVLSKYPNAHGVLKDFKVFITPRHGGKPRVDEFTWLGLRQGDAEDRPDGIISITEDAILGGDCESPASGIKSDDSAFASVKCEHCLVRSICPKLTHLDATDLSDWIVLDPEAPITNEPILYFTIRIENGQRTTLYERDFSVTILQPLINKIVTGLIASQRISRSKIDYLIDFIARREGLPQVDPLLLPRRRTTGYRIEMDIQISSPPPSQIGPPPASLVDWNQLEAEQNEDDPDITFIDTELDTLPSKLMPRLDLCQAVGSVSEKDLMIFVKRSVAKGLASNSLYSPLEKGGILLGYACLDSELHRHYLEIIGLIPARLTPVATGQYAEFILDSSVWQDVERGLAHEYAGGRILGWFRLHLFDTRKGNAQIFWESSRTTRDDLLDMRKDEHFVHSAFFRETWQVGLVASPYSKNLRFFQWQGNMIVTCPGYFITD